MPATSIQSPFPIFTDIDGQPLEQGQVWLGTAGNNPISSPITAYWDAALTQVVTQPVTTRGGYPLNGTAVGRLYVNADFSILVRNRRGYDVLSALSATERFDSSLVTFLQAGLGAVARTAQAKMRDVVSVKDFGAVGDGVADDTVAIQEAIDASDALVVPLGNFKLTLNVNTDAPIGIAGVASSVKFIDKGIVVGTGSAGRYGFLNYIQLDGPNNGTGVGLSVNDTHRVKFEGIFAKEYLEGANFNYSYLTTLTNCEFSFNSTGAVFRNFTNGTSVYSCTFANNTNHGAEVKSSQKFVFHGCDFENNTNYGLVVNSSDNGTLQNLNGTVDSCYFENNASDVIVGSGANASKTTGWVFKDNCHLGSKTYGYLVDYAFGTKIIRPDFTGATFSAAAISLTANSQNTTIIPFIASQVQAAPGATVSVETVQTGSVDVSLDGSGFGDVAISFPIQYYVTPPVRLLLYSDTNPSGTLGTASIKNGIGVTGIYVQVHGGPGSTTVKVQWQAGA